MPNYEFQCLSCEQRFSKTLPFGTKDFPPCPACNGTAKRLVSAPMVHFKGSGFYKTDSQKKSETKKPDSTPHSASTTPPASATPTSKKDPAPSAS